MTAELRDVMSALGQLAPLRYAESWDNVGLIIGETSRAIKRVMLTIDMTEEILMEAVESKADLIVTYHPVLFQPVQRITDETPEGRMLLSVMHHDICIYSPHTALDAAPGGVTDWLADAIGSGYRRPLQTFEELPRSAEAKVIVFVPHDAVDRVRDALATTGAGRIGEYDHCSFSTPGTGSFRGNENTNPAVGEAGQLEMVPEVRLEMVCPRSALPLLVTTLRQFHPYEEPAFDLYPLLPTPRHEVGCGRRVVLDQPAMVRDIATELKNHLRIDRLKATNPDRRVRTVGFVPGAGADFVETAIRDSGCELFVTGEMKHHEALHAEQLGCAIILTGHTNSERGYLPILQDRILERTDSKIDVVISSKDRTRFEVM